MITEVLLFLILVFVLRNYIKSCYKDFEKAAVPFAPTVPILGSVWRSFLRRCNITEEIQKIYNEVGDDRCRYIGLFHFNTPIVLIKDLDLLKQVTIKDFDHFNDHKVFDSDDDDNDEMFGKSLFSLKGQKWRDMRSTLSPAFTSTKIKNMCPFISECGLQMTNYLKEISKDKKYIELEFRDISSRFTNDVIASSAFGLKVDSFKEKENEFFLMGKEASTFNLFRMLTFIIKMKLPALGKRLKLKIINDKINNFFKDLISSAMIYREKEHIVRPDMIHLLMEAKKGSLTHEDASDDKDTGFATVEESTIGTRQSKRVWTDDELIAQAFLFFAAGFDTVSTVASFTLHELAANPDVQAKLQKEIDEHLDGEDKNITYETLQKMKYVDMVISEGLRKWPPVPQIDRHCTKDFNLGPVRHGQDTPTYTVKKGDLVWIPIKYIHHDPKYWNEPEKFNPERFSDEHKNHINPMTFLPFGSGPRNCIASRFALVELKMLLVHLLSEFNVQPCSKTDIPIILDPNMFNMKPRNGFWFNFVPRHVDSN